MMDHFQRRELSSKGVRSAGGQSLRNVKKHDLSLRIQGSSRRYATFCTSSVDSMNSPLVLQNKCEQQLTALYEKFQWLECYRFALRITPLPLQGSWQKNSG